MRVRLLMSSAALAAAFLALFAAGCGKSSDTKANEAYADSVCSAIGTWEQDLRTIASSFTSGGISKASLQASLTQAVSATKTLVQQIGAVPAPDTDEGQAAKQQLKHLTDDVTSTAKAAQSSLNQLSDNASTATITAAVATLVPQVQSLASQATSAVTSIKDAGGSLADAFKSTESCNDLG